MQQKRAAADPSELYCGMRRLAFGEPLPSDPPLLAVDGTVDQLVNRLGRADSSFEQWMIWKALRKQGHEQSPNQAAQVLVMICEFALAGALVTLVAHRDGNASMYLSTGGGVIGGGGHRNVADAAGALCVLGESVAPNMPKSSAAPAPPAAGEFVASALLASGIRVRRDLEKAVRSKTHELHLIYMGMHNLVAQLRLVETGKSTRSTEDAGPYANCLLTLMAENGSGDVTIVAGEPLPSLGGLARTADQRQWIATEGPKNVDSIDSRHVMKILQRNCRFGWFSRSGVFVAKLARGNGALSDFTFQVERGRNAEGRKTLQFRL